MTKDICDQTPIKMEFTYEEHDLLNSILNHAQESYHFVSEYCDIHDLPEDSEIPKRYKMLESLRERSWELWSGRYRK
tara:strand:- start:4277 stop:4507 length:231 start_codon:yes stop_codon:yes gene_type:complete